MSRTLSHAAVLVATAGTSLVLAAAPAAAGACADPVAKALHQVHDTTGDPAGAAHEAEEAYCSVAP